MKTLSLFFLLCGFAVVTSAQRVQKSDLLLLQHKEDSMKVFADRLIQGITATDRFNADSIFTKMFVRALKTSNSFFYPFDSLQTISKLYPPDSTFRIFTWQLVVNENMVRQHGAIQMRTADGTLKLFPLIDKSDITINQADTFANNKGWIGAVYYKIIETRSGNQNFYTLLGYDENNIRSNRKIIEVLNFSNDEPTFGGRHFSFEEDSVFKSAMSRYILEYKKNAGARLTYDADMDMIVFEHLESETNEPTKKWTYIPDGDYEGFKWKNGKWIHISKVFTLVTPEGQEPIPNPVKDAEGNTLEDKLQNNVPEEPAVIEKPAAVKKNAGQAPKKFVPKKKKDE
ncbi:MAG: hypothetical protein Q7T76_06010 [Ferruginibacter sp.]|nr:hypothetical protein [Ferruginibacter sp.]